jgi:pectin methylesterase-like acyl-CoA thioesterase
LTGLSLKTTHHVRAYATNSVGTAYSSGRSFTTPEGSTLYVSKSGCGTKEPCYSSLQEAVESAGSRPLIKIVGGAYFEDIVLDEPNTLTLQGDGFHHLLRKIRKPF